MKHQDVFLSKHTLNLFSVSENPLFSYKEFEKEAGQLPESLTLSFENDIKHVPKKVFEPQKTVKLASEWAIDNDLVNYADYGPVNVDVANAMNQLLFYHLQEFPGLRDKQKFIGTIEQHCNFMEDAYIKNFGAHIWFTRSYAEYVTKPITINHAYMLSWNDSLVSGISVNEKWGKNLNNFQNSLCDNVKLLFHPVGCDTIKSVADHEFGHQLDDLLELNDLSEIKSLYREALAGGIAQLVSNYAGTNIKEFIAECWAEALNHENPRRFASEIAKIIRSEYRHRFAAS
jgi:hypothetical protein